MFELFFDHRTDGHIHKSLREIATKVKSLELDCLSIVSFSPKQKTLEKVDPNNAFLDWILVIFSRVHEKEPFAFVLTL